ncbi:hypothetical protein [Sulfurospirillum halorespirans]|nr:hypothetical protein [Sulfurospirillum halorespirans]
MNHCLLLNKFYRVVATLETLLEPSSKNYANAEFSSAESPRTFGAFIDYF